MPEHKVKINYRSGRTELVECDKLKVTANGAKITEIEWSGAVPRPLHLGVDDVESVWELS